MATEGTPPQDRKVRAKRPWETVAQELSQEMDSARIIELVNELDEALLLQESINRAKRSA